MALENDARRLILVRHAEAEGQGCYIGRGSDPPLSDRGREQAHKLRRQDFPCPRRDGAVLFSSPLRRAVETAEILFGHEPDAAEIEIVHDFAEIDFGRWEGLGWREISRMEESRYRQWLDKPVETSPPGGESLKDFSERVGACLEDVFKRIDLLKADTACFVVHAGVIRSILCLLLELPPDKHWSFEIGCASVSSLKIFGHGFSDKNRSAVVEYLNLF